MNKNFAMSLLAAGVFASGAAFAGGGDPAPDPGNGYPITTKVDIDPNKKVLVIGIDGTRPDVIAKSNTPYIDSLIANGAYSTELQAPDTSWSAAGWSTIMYGVWRDKHGVTENSYSGSKLADFPDLFTHLESQANDVQTARVTSWDAFPNHMPTSADVDYFSNYSSTQDIPTTAKSVELLSDPATDVVFHYFSMVDATGHNHGFHKDVTEYIASMELVDQQIGELLQAINNRPNRANEDWLIIATTDHGGDMSGHGKNNPEHRYSWLFISGDNPNVPKGGLYPDPSQVDVVTTVLDFYGLTTGSPLDLDGRTLLQPQTVPVPQLGQNIVRNGDAEIRRGITAFGYDANVPAWRDIDGGVVVAYGSPDFPASGSVSNGGNNFFAGETSHNSAMSQVIDVSNLNLDGDESFTLSAHLGGYQDHDDNARVIARFDDGSGAAATIWDGNKAYFFKGNQYYRFDLSSDTTDSGYPKTIDTTTWPGLEKFTGGAGNIDAVLNWGTGKAYFFKGDEYIRYDIASDKADPGYPQSIISGWPGLDKFEGGARDLDAAIDWTNGNVYFFKGAQYIRYNKSGDSADYSYPRFIGKNSWNGMQVWPLGIDAAFRASSSHAYMFKEGQYVRYNIVTDQVHDGTYPRAIDSSSWPGLSDWYFGVRSAQVGPVTDADRNSQTGFQFRTTTGSVPANTQSVEVSVRYEASWQGTDGYADNVSLTINP